MFICYFNGQLIQINEWRERKKKTTHIDVPMGTLLCQIFLFAINLFVFGFSITFYAGFFVPFCWTRRKLLNTKTCDLEDYQFCLQEIRYETFLSFSSCCIILSNSSFSSFLCVCVCLSSILFHNLQSNGSKNRSQNPFSYYLMQVEIEQKEKK